MVNNPGGEAKGDRPNKNIVIIPIPLSIIYSTNHIFTGIMHMLVALIGASIGVGLSVLLRMELSLPGLILASGKGYNSVLSFHGILMTPFMVMPPLIGGFGNLLVPLMPCPCDTIFPRLNALSL